VTQSLQDFNLKNSTGDNLSEKTLVKTGLQVGPLSAFTPEIVDIIKEAGKRIDESKNLRSKSRALMKECFEKITNANKTVDTAFIRKLEENLLLSVRGTFFFQLVSKIIFVLAKKDFFQFCFKKNLSVSSAENQLANNRAVRWHDLNEISYKYSLGPEKSTNLNLYEKLERPIIKTFQKHPGNQVPEAQEIHKVLRINRNKI
jgi:hypothetical protein